MNYLLVLLSAYTVLGAPVTVHPCQLLTNANATSFKPSEMRACLQTVPFSPAVRTNQLEIAKAMTSISIFEYEQLNNTNPALYQGVNLEQEYERMYKTDYQSDWEFQTDLSSVIGRLNDGHYSSSNCYSNIVTSHALPLVALNDTTKCDHVIIVVAPDIDLVADALGVKEMYYNLGINISRIAGAKVMYINGDWGWDYVKRTSRGFQDPQTRLNAAFAHYGSDEGIITREPGSFTIADRRLLNDTITVSISFDEGKTTEDLVVPWRTYFKEGPFNYTSGEDLFKSRCLMKPITVENNSTTDDPETVKTFAELVREAYTQCPLGEASPGDIPLPDSPQNTSAYLGGRDVQAYVLPNTTTGLIYVQTFLPTGPACISRWIVDAGLAVRNLTTAGVKNLLIDTSGNRGGSPLLSQVLQQMLTGREFFLANNMEVLVRKSPISEALVKGHIATNITTGPFRQTQFQWPNLTSLTTSDNYFIPGNERRVNNRTYYASNLVQDATQALEEITRDFQLPIIAPWGPGRIKFTGNGLCSSSCSQLTSYLIEYWNATGVINTPEPERPIEYHNILASVIGDDDVYNEAEALDLDILPPPRSVTGRFSFACNANLSPKINPENFVQYTSYPAKERLALTPEQYLSPMKQWLAAEKIAFGQGEVH